MNPLQSFPHKGTATVPDLSYIRPPVDPALLQQELTKRHFLRTTNKGHKEIYVVTAHSAPHVMQEIGRLREIAFATEGGGTGQPVDIDAYDTLPEPHCFKQLIVWDPAERAIVGGYRFLHGSHMERGADGHYDTPMAHLFRYSAEFESKYLPYTIEMARAWVQPAYQPTVNLRKGMYSLDNLWDGLGAVAVEVPETLYFMGKVTTYSTLPDRAKAMLHYYLHKHFPDPDALVLPIHPVETHTTPQEVAPLFTGRNSKEDFKILMAETRAMGASIPPLFGAYVNLSSTMRVFGTTYNADFGHTDDTGILVTISDLYLEKRLRYVDTYTQPNRLIDRLRLFRVNLRRMPWWHNMQERRRVMKERRLRKTGLRRRPAPEGSSAWQRRQKRQYRRNARQQRRLERVQRRQQRRGALRPRLLFRRKK